MTAIYYPISAIARRVTSVVAFATPLVPAQAYVGKWLGTLKEFPPRRKPGSFSLSEVMEKLRAGVGSR